MPRSHKNSDLYLDGNGCLTERVELDGQTVVIHYDDIPDSDITTVEGVRCTTPVRTVIDIAPDVGAAELEQIIRHCLGQGLFTIDEALARCSAPDMSSRRGAQLVRQMVTQVSG